MVSAENRTGLYVTVPVYFCVLGGCAYWAHRRMAALQHDGVSGKIAAHYLGGRDFGWIVTSGTFFASLFSGYTVIGVPNDAFRNGFFITWWIPSLMSVVAGCYGTGLRLRKCSDVRDHQSPVDFITDRFQSQLLRYVVCFLQVVPGIIYLSAQVIAIKGTFNSIFELDPDATYPVVIIMGLILSFEWIGGLSSVALTDTIQAVVMILSFIIIPSVIHNHFGGWPDIDLESYPRPDFYQTFSKTEQWNFWQLSVINFSFFTLPHLLQRNYAARDLGALKAGYIIMTVGPWFTTFVGVFLGTVGVKMLGEGANPPNPFSAVIEAVMDIGGFAKGAGVIGVTAGLAAIMSTADSLIIAVSQLITMEVIRPKFPDASPDRLTWFARFVSLGSVLIALLIGLLWDEGITALGRIQFPLSTQAVPAFLYGLFCKNRSTDLHPWSIAAGAVASSIFVLAFFFGYLNVADNPRPVNAGISGFCINLAVTAGAEVLRRQFLSKKEETEYEADTTDLLFPDRPDWDVPNLERFGEKSLTPQYIWGLMKGVEEPLTNLTWVVLFFATITMCTPLTPENEPPLVDGVFSYLPALVGGLPWWYFKLLMISAMSTLILLFAIFRMPHSFPDTKSVDANVDAKSEQAQDDKVEAAAEEVTVMA